MNPTMRSRPIATQVRERVTPDFHGTSRTSGT